MGRIVRAVAAVVVVAVGCVGSGDPDPEPRDRPEQGDDDPASGRDEQGKDGGDCLTDGRTVEPEVDVGTLDVVNHRTRMVSVGDVLLAAAHVDTGVERRGPDIVRSTDCGATWERVELPGAPLVPDSGMNETLARVGDLVVITAEIHLDPAPEGDTFVWTSTDGEDWEGGAVDVPSPEDALHVGTSSVWQMPDGNLVVPLDLTLDRPQPVLESGDGGATWQVADCPAGSLDQLGTQFSCWELMRAGELWVRRFIGEVSLDDARSWRRPELRPEPPDLSDYPKIDAVVALSGTGEEPDPRLQLRSRPDAGTEADASSGSGGGWLATFLADVGDCPSVTLSSPSECLGFLARSDDGVRWETVLASDDTCPDAGEVGAGLGDPNSRLSAPVPLGERWLVVATCGDGMTPQRSEAHTVDASGRNPRPLVETDDPGVSFDQPVALPDGVVIPRIDPAGTTATLLQLTP